MKWLGFNGCWRVLTATAASAGCRANHLSCNRRANSTGVFSARMLVSQQKPWKNEVIAELRRSSSSTMNTSLPCGALKRSLQFGHFGQAKAGEIRKFSLVEIFCWPREVGACNDFRKWSHYTFRAVS